ncbi:hypothetical protein HYH03_009710 [Edaphochlamys debaryana]|uniref:Uncharacterized protein n=1 Tax=Edaphochlamys debaryana TaxID=47281 RepID=A0A836BY81_9CHLO|nr:hypothetical protein HYH03_009710 [Edaphochlamys debaryana]|eukprot:KAG2491979.1 hypothetical protein HYH03_009710 [Edaphochlamys debaryana]
MSDEASAWPSGGAPVPPWARRVASSRQPPAAPPGGLSLLDDADSGPALGDSKEEPLTPAQRRLLVAAGAGIPAYLLTSRPSQQAQALAQQPLRGAWRAGATYRPALRAAATAVLTAATSAITAGPPPPVPLEPHDAKLSELLALSQQRHAHWQRGKEVQEERQREAPRSRVQRSNRPRPAEGSKQGRREQEGGAADDLQFDENGDLVDVYLKPLTARTLQQDVYGAAIQLETAPPPGPLSGGGGARGEGPFAGGRLAPSIFECFARASPTAPVPDQSAPGPARALLLLRCLEEVYGGSPSGNMRAKIHERQAAMKGAWALSSALLRYFGGPTLTLPELRLFVQVVAELHRQFHANLDTGLTEQWLGPLAPLTSIHAVTAIVRALASELQPLGMSLAPPFGPPPPPARNAKAAIEAAAAAVPAEADVQVTLAQIVAKIHVEALHDPKIVAAAMSMHAQGKIARQVLPGPVAAAYTAAVRRLVASKRFAPAELNNDTSVVVANLAGVAANGQPPPGVPPLPRSAFGLLGGPQMGMPFLTGMGGFQKGLGHLEFDLLKKSRSTLGHTLLSRVMPRLGDTLATQVLGGLESLADREGAPPRQPPAVAGPELRIPAGKADVPEVRADLARALLAVDLEARPVEVAAAPAGGGLLAAVLGTAALSVLRLCTLTEVQKAAAQAGQGGGEVAAQEEVADAGLAARAPPCGAAALQPVLHSAGGGDGCVLMRVLPLGSEVAERLAKHYLVMAKRAPYGAAKVDAADLRRPAELLRVAKDMAVELGLGQLSCLVPRQPKDPDCMEAALRVLTLLREEVLLPKGRDCVAVPYLPHLKDNPSFKLLAGRLGEEILVPLGKDSAGRANGGGAGSSGRGGFDNGGGDGSRRLRQGWRQRRAVALTRGLCELLGASGHPADDEFWILRELSSKAYTEQGRVLADMHSGGPAAMMMGMGIAGMAMASFGAPSDRDLRDAIEAEAAYRRGGLSPAWVDLPGGQSFPGVGSPCSLGFLVLEVAVPEGGAKEGGSWQGLVRPKQPASSCR